MTRSTAIRLWNLLDRVIWLGIGVFLGMQIASGSVTVVIDGGPIEVEPEESEPAERGWWL